MAIGYLSNDEMAPERASEIRCSRGQVRGPTDAAAVDRSSMISCCSSSKRVRIALQTVARHITHLQNLVFMEGIWRLRRLLTMQFMCRTAYVCERSEIFVAFSFKTRDRAGPVIYIYAHGRSIPSYDCRRQVQTLSPMPTNYRSGVGTGTSVMTYPRKSWNLRFIRSAASGAPERVGDVFRCKNKV